MEEWKFSRSDYDNRDIMEEQTEMEARLTRSPQTTPLKSLRGYTGEADENMVILLKDLHDLAQQNNLANTLTNNNSVQSLENLLQQLISASEKSIFFVL